MRSALLVGLSFGLGFPAVNVQATAGIADEEQGLVSGLVNTSLQIGGMVVLAIVTCLLGASPSSHNHRLLPGMTTAITAIAIVAGIGVLASTLSPRHCGERDSDGEHHIHPPRRPGQLAAVPEPGSASGRVA